MAIKTIKKMIESVRHRIQTGTVSRAAAIVGSMLGLGMLLAASAIALFAWLADEVFEGDSLAFDNAVREFVHSLASGWLTALMQFFSFVGSALVLTVSTVLLIVIFLVRKQHRRSLLLGAVMVGASILNFVLKTYFVRERPAPYFDTPLPSSFSFPSGHSLLTACFCACLAWIFFSGRSGKLKIAGCVAAGLVILLVGPSRVYLGVHYPTDVLAGYLAATVWVTAVVSADSFIERPTGN